MPAPLTIYLMRHGEVYNPEHILYGRMPGYYLSDNGKSQAQSASDYLRHKTIQAVYSSPMERAQQTARIIATPHGHSIQIDERLNESYTPFDGTPHSELEKTAFDIYTGNQPPYELLSDMRRRVLNFIHEKRQQHGNQAIAIVSHGDIVVTVFMWANGKHPDDAGRGQLQSLGMADMYPATASINTLIFHTSDATEIPEYHYHRPY